MNVLDFKVSDGRKSELRKRVLTFKNEQHSQEFTFPSDLNGYERDFVTNTARALHVSVKTTGGKSSRRVCVYKIPGEAGNKAVIKLQVSINQESVKKILQVLSTTFKPEALVKPEIVDTRSSAAWLRKPRPLLPSSISESRGLLPATERKQDFLNHIYQNQILLIQGDTGCGKSTQLPQFILEDVAQRDGECRIICTQPRRIAAISVALRVASERNESLGHTVGYHVRNDQQCSSSTCLTYCTTGILLQGIINDPDHLKKITYLFIDEIHERDLDVDFLLGILKFLLNSLQDLKIILMSASMDSSILQKFFQLQLPVLKISGNCFKLEDFFLGKVLVDIKTLEKKKTEETAPAEEDGETTLAEEAKLLDEYKKSRKPNTIDCELIVRILAVIEDRKVDGAVLVFLAGYDQIMEVFDKLSGESIYKVFPLHSGLPTAEQKLVLTSPPPGKRKVVLATNVAETSITISDVVYVIDSGKVRVKTFDPTTGVSWLKTEWISKASAEQRKGRAGRCQPGICYRLFTKDQFDSFPSHPVPEIQRVSILQLCLRIKSVAPEDTSISTFLQQLPEAPKQEAISDAIQTLQYLGALDESQNITNVGRLLLKLPVDPRFGKMLLTSAVLGCLNPILAIVSCMTCEDPFRSRAELRDSDLVASYKLKLAQKSLSDHMVYIQLLQLLDADIAEKGDLSEEEYAEKFLLSKQKIDFIFRTRDQISRQLAAAGFKIQDLNRNSSNWVCIKSALVSGLCPMVGQVIESKKISTSLAQEVYLDRSSALLARETGTRGKPLDGLPSRFMVYSELFKFEKSPARINCATLVTPVTIALFGGSSCSPNVNESLKADHASTAGQSVPMRNSDGGPSVKKRKPNPATDIRLDDLIHLHCNEAEKVFALRQEIQSMTARRLENPAYSPSANDTKLVDVVIQVLESQEKAANFPSAPELSCGN